MPYATTAMITTQATTIATWNPLPQPSERIVTLSLLSCRRRNIITNPISGVLTALTTYRRDFQPVDSEPLECRKLA
jgi:hypothetical protein